FLPPLPLGATGHRRRSETSHLRLAESLAHLAVRLSVQCLLRGHGLPVCYRPDVHGCRNAVLVRGGPFMTVAYIANQFPSSIEPYVMDEISELRKRGVRVICCSGKRVRPGELGEREREFWNETRFFNPLSDTKLVRAVRRLGA